MFRASPQVEITPEGGDDTKQNVKDQAQETKEQAKGFFGKLKDTVSGTADQAQEKTSQASQQASEKTSSSYSSAKSKTSSTNTSSTKVQRLARFNRNTSAVRCCSTVDKCALLCRTTLVCCACPSIV